MRRDSNSPLSDLHLHWHDGSTCHGASTLDACVREAITRGWVGKVLRVDDVYPNGSKASCFSLITGSFDHHAKRGTFVAVVELTSRLL